MLTLDQGALESARHLRASLNSRKENAVGKFGVLADFYPAHIPAKTTNTMEIATATAARPVATRRASYLKKREPESIN